MSQQSCLLWHPQRMLLKARPLRQRYMRKHTCRKRQESFLNAYTAYFQLSYLLYADNPLAYIHTTTSHTISETAHTVCQKGLSANLQRQACTVCGYWQREAAYAVFMSPITTNSASRSLLAVAQFHTHPFLFYFLHHLFSFTVLYFCYSHIGFLSALPLRIFTAKVQVVRHTSNRASMDASEKSSSVCAI